MYVNIFFYISNHTFETEMLNKKGITIRMGPSPAEFSIHHSQQYGLK